jgi:hypothetical protein
MPALQRFKHLALDFMTGHARARFAVTKPGNLDNEWEIEIGPSGVVD